MRCSGLVGVPLEPLTPDSCGLLEDRGIDSDLGGAANGVEEGQRIADALGDRKAVILRNHGLTTVGKSFPEAVWWFVTMDRSWRIASAICATSAVAAYGLGAGREWLLAFALLACADRPSSPR